MPGPVLLGRVLADERAPLVVVGLREQRLQRHLAVAVERIPVGERELGALGDDVDELGRRELGEIEAVEERELLQPHRPGRPRQRLADRQPAVLELGDRLERRAPARHVLAGEEPAFGGGEPVDLLGDEALVVRAAGLLDLLLARASARLLDDPAIGRRERRVAEERADLRCRQVEVARAGPPAAAAPRCARSSRGSRRRAGSRAPRSRSRTRARPRAARSRTAPAAAASRRRRRGRRPRARRFRGRARGRDRGSARSSPRPGAHALAAERNRLAAVDREEQRRHLAAGPVQMRLDDLQRQAGRDRRVERVAAALEHRHPGRGCEPVGRRDHAERAAQLRAGREGHWMIRQVVVPCASSFPFGSVSFPSAVAIREPWWMTIPSQRITPVSAVIGRTKFVFTSSVV